MWHVKLLNSRTQKFHEPRNHMSHGTSMKFENFRNFEQNLRVVQIPCDFLKSIFLIFLPENLNLYQKFPKIFENLEFRPIFETISTRKHFDFRLENFAKLKFSWKSMKIHVLGPFNAYIHLIDSFQALKVEIF